METKNRENELNLLLDSLSAIDGDLLADVRPADPVKKVQTVRTHRAWQRYAVVAASLLVLVGAGLVIRLLFPGGGITGMKSIKPEDYDTAEYGQVPPGFSGSQLELDDPGYTENASIHTADNGARGAAVYQAAAIHQPWDLLQNSWEMNSAYSPLLVFLGLVELGDGDCEGAEWYFPQSPYLSSRSALIAPGLSAGDRQKLLDDESWPLAYEDGLHSSASMDLLQDLDLELTLRVMAETGAPSKATYALLPGVSVYEQEDGTVLAKLPAGDFSLYLALPPEGRSPKDLLAREGFVTDLLALEGTEGQAGVRLAPFTVTDSHDRAAGEFIKNLSPGRRIYQTIDLSVRFEAVEPGLCLSTMIEFSRPFVFAVKDQGVLPLLLGIIYPPGG
ncbi:MAG TPA: hypothetical protein GX720_04945 [Clostridiaceae bacterium]|nr:hypothetical protein [Clostridiaceae bacterium]